MRTKSRTTARVECLRRQFEVLAIEQYLLVRADQLAAMQGDASAGSPQSQALYEGRER